jgi:hypothetical protein
MRSDRCKHFTGLAVNNTCKAGVEYNQVTTGEGRPSKRLPCFNAELQCEKREYPTQEELDAWDREINEQFEKTTQARGAIIKHAGGKRGVSGDLPCPVCDSGTLKYSIAMSNGHVWASCTTSDCVAWME